MSGTTRYLGYVRGSNGPDLAKVEAGQQVVSHIGPNSPSSGNSPSQAFIAYAVGGYVGNWYDPAVIRYGVFSASSSSAAPGSLLRQTGEIAPTVNYVDAGGGQYREAPLESPLLIDTSDTVAAGIASRSNPAGVAMYQASAISQPNESFYRKGVSGNSLQSASGSTSSNEGQLALRIIGEYNVAPTAPTNMSPGSGAGDVRAPNIAGNFNDANTTLNDNRAWDYAAQAQIQVREGTSVIWDYTYTTSSKERNNHRTVRRYAGPALKFYTTYSYRLRHIDRAGATGAWSDWVYFNVRHNNRAPNLPSSFTGAGTQTGSRSVTVSAAFSDPDYPTLPDGQQYERFEQKQVIVRRVSDNAIVYNSGIVNATVSERNNLRSSTSYTLPQWDVQYRHYERHFDRNGASSGYATVLVMARSGGSMETPTSPTPGRKTNPSNPGNVSAVYRNEAAINATTIQFRLINQNNVGMGFATFSGVNVARNTTFTRTWAQAFPDITLWPGTTWGLTVRASVPGSDWTDYSDPVWFTMNSQPNTPTLYGPRDGNVASYLNTTSVRASDDDADEGSLTITSEYYDSGNNLIGTRELPYLPDAGGSRANVYGATPTDIITGYGTYKWRARSFDGFLHSDWSPMWTFTYANVPSVTITEPAGPEVTTSQPMFTWESTGQTAWRIQGREGERLVYDTGEQPGGDQQHLISGGQYWIGGEQWNNHESFEWTVQVQDSSTLWGSSETLSLTLEYIPPEPLIVDGEAGVLPGVKGTHYAILSHSQTDYLQDEFIAYVWSRVEIDGPGGNEVPGTSIADFARNTNSGDPVLVDFDMASNQWYRWGVRQEVQQGVDVIASDPVFVELMVSWYGTLLHMPFDPLGNYIWLQYGEVGGNYEPSRDHNLIVTSETDLNGEVHNYIAGMPTIAPSGSYTFLGNSDATAMSQLDTLYRLFVYQNPKFSPDGRPHGMVWREGRGGRNGRQSVLLANWRDTSTMGRTQSVELQFIPNVNGGVA